MKNFETLTLFFCFGIIGVFILIKYQNATKIDNLKNYKILELQQQQIISGSRDHLSTKIRYLIITDKETFICSDSFFNSKFDNSNVFFHLQKGKSYDFKVCGFGKSLFFDYRNILEAKQLN